MKKGIDKTMLYYVKQIRKAKTPKDILLNVDHLCDILDYKIKVRKNENKTLVIEIFYEKI